MKERYTRSASEDAERDVRVKEEQARKHPGHLQPSAEQSILSVAKPLAGHEVPSEYVRSEEEKQYAQARQRLERLKTEGHKEALKLEEEHEKLTKEFREAQHNLRTFEKEQLGMQRDEADNRPVGSSTTTG